MISAAGTLWDRTNQFAKRNWASLARGIIPELGFALFLLLTNANNWTSLPGLFFVLFLIYLFTIWWARKRIPHDSEGLLVILIFAVAFRLTLLFSGPVFSFDLYRYIWDGKVAASGVNPYLYPPEAPELSSLRDANWELINHKYIRTGYPPLMEIRLEERYGLRLGSSAHYRDLSDRTQRFSSRLPCALVVSTASLGPALLLGRC